MSAPRALVTGITGQDGGYLTEQLAAGGWQVHGAIRADEQPPEHLLALGFVVTLHEVDLLDPVGVGDLLEAVDAEEVYNLAGVSSVAQSWVEPVLTARINAEAVLVLLECLWRRHRPATPTRFLQASSAEIFAGAADAPQDESTPLAPRSPYGASKAFAHHLVHVYRARGLPAVNAILYNHESPRRPPSFVTRKITQAVAAIADGSDVRLQLGNLDARRDWGWAPDYTRGMSLALRHEMVTDWVLASGRSHSIREFVAAAFAHVDIDDWDRFVETADDLVRPSDARELRGDPSKANRVLGWQSELSFPELVGRMVDADRARR